MEQHSRLIKANMELLCVVLFVLDLFVFKTRILAVASMVFFILEFLGYRWEAVLNYRRSKSLREGMTLANIRSIERKYSSGEDSNSFEKQAMMRPPLDRYFYFAKYERVRELLISYGSKEGLWLDLGCGFGEDTFYITKHLSKKVIGIELDEIKLLEALKKFRRKGNSTDAAFCVGDALHVPFRSGRFNTILMTEVIEHLIDPEEGIKNCRYLLQEGGILVVSTQSLHNLGYSLNPFLLLEKAVSLTDDKVIPPYHNLHARFEYNWRRPEPEYGIHYHFSKKELRRMLTQNRFQILWEGTFEIEIPPYLFVEFLLNGDVGKIEKVIRPVEKFLRKIPLINQFGQHLLFVTQKKSL